MSEQIGWGQSILVVLRQSQGNIPVSEVVRLSLLRRTRSEAISWSIARHNSTPYSLKAKYVRFLV
jgi:hypothetical protein